MNMRWELRAVIERKNAGREGEDEGEIPPWKQHVRVILNI